MKKVLLSILLTSLLVLNGCGFAGDPMIDNMYTQNAYPGIDSTYDVGAVGNEYANGFFDNLFVGGAPLADIVSATLVVAADDSLDATRADYQCDGVADDVQINAALVAGAGGRIMLLEGTYDIGSNLTVPANTKLEGQGWGTILNFDDGGGGAITNAGAITINGNNVHIMNLKAVIAAGCGAAGTRPNVVNATGRTLLWLENLWIVGDITVDDAHYLRQNGIFFSATTHSKVLDCLIENNQENGIEFFSTSRYNIVTNNTLTGNVSYGIYSRGASYNTISDNKIQGNESGIYNYSGGGYSVITGNSCTGNITYGIYFSSADSSIVSGNSLSLNAVGLFAYLADHSNFTGNTANGNTGSYGLYIRNSVNNTIAGNSCNGNASHNIYSYRTSYSTITGNTANDSVGGDGIHILGAGATNADYNIVAGNNCSNNADDGIEIAGGANANYNSVSSNILDGNGGTDFVDGGTNTTAYIHSVLDMATYPIINVGTITAQTAQWWHEYILPASAFSQGASGATTQAPNANTLGGWLLDRDVALEELNSTSHIEDDWDGASDPIVEIYFEVNVDNTLGADADTVDIQAIFRYKGDGETVVKTQTVVDAVVVGKSAQFKQFKSTIILNWDLGGNVLEAADIVSIAVGLVAATSEVTDIILNFAEFKYHTDKPAPEV